MPQYDAILRWSNIVAARTDAVALSNMLPDDQSIQQWMTDHCIPNVMAWRASQNPNGIEVDGVYLPGYYAIVSADHIIRAISNSSALQLVWDRDLLNSGAPAAQYILINNINGSIPLSDVRFAPVFMGTRLPWSN